MTALASLEWWARPTWPRRSAPRRSRPARGSGRGAAVTRPIAAQRRCAGAAPVGASVLGLASALGLASGMIAGGSPRRGRRTGHGWRQGRPARHRLLLDLCLLQRLRDRRDRRLRGCDLRRNDYDAQIGCLDPSILPREAEARKPTSLATEGQAQQQRVDQQREQQRTRESPIPRTHAWAVGQSLDPVELSRAPPSLLGHCCRRGAGWHLALCICRPGRPTGHDLAQGTSETFVSRIRSIVLSTPVRLGSILTCPNEPSKWEEPLRPDAQVCDFSAGWRSKTPVVSLMARVQHFCNVHAPTA